MLATYNMPTNRGPNKIVPDDEALSFPLEHDTENSDVSHRIVLEAHDAPHSALNVDKQRA